jgi:iron-sulfur cluster repair protein YtfE (RIC family)
MNILDLLISQHKEVDGLFKQYDGGDHQVANTIAEKLELHTKIEEELVYPAISAYVEGGSEMVEHAKEEHKDIDEDVAALKEDIDNDTIFTDIKEDVTHHVEEEETEIFPALKEACPEGYLEQLYEQAKQRFGV